MIKGLEITDGFISKKLMFCVNCNVLKVVDADNHNVMCYPCNCVGLDQLHKELQLDYFKD